MSESTYARAFADVYERELENDPNLPFEVMKLRKKLLQGDLDWAADYFGQAYMDAWSDAEIYALANLLADIHDGKFLFSTVYLGCSPTSDKNIELNQKMLDTGLSKASSAVSRVEGHSVYFDGVVLNGCGDCDGHITWTNQLCFQTVGEGCVPFSRYLTAPAEGIALEIGNQAFSKSLVYMRNSGGYPMGFLARWAYESNFLHIGYYRGDDI
jgi:hypothetical protein